MSVKGWPWVVLDLSSPTTSTAEVRRAYARKLKTINQATDIAGFETLRKAYEAALARTEQKARKAASLAKMAPRIPQAASVPDIAPDPRPVPHAGDSPATALTEAAPPSTEERLDTRFRGLAERNLLVSLIERVWQILDDPDFQSPELEPQLRDGFARYIRSQLLSNHLGEPYLRHPGVTADLLKTLDTRFGWISDYSASRRDFRGDERMLEAMVEAAGIDRGPQDGQLRRSSRFDFRSFFVPAGILGGAAFLIFVKQEVDNGSEDIGVTMISGLLVGLLVFALYGLGFIVVYGFRAIMRSRRLVVATGVWAMIGGATLLIARESLVGFPLLKWPLTLSVWLSSAAVLSTVLLWIWRKLALLISRRFRNQT